MTGFLHFHVQTTQFKLLTGWDSLTEYRFESLSAQHWFCKVCGVQAFYKSRSNPNEMDINLRCLDTDNVDIYAFEYELTDGQNWPEWNKVRQHRFNHPNDPKTPPATKYRLLATEDPPRVVRMGPAEFRSVWEPYTKDLPGAAA